MRACTQCSSPLLELWMSSAGSSVLMSSSSSTAGPARLFVVRRDSPAHVGRDAPLPVSGWPGAAMPPATRHRPTRKSPPCEPTRSLGYIIPPRGPRRTKVVSMSNRPMGALAVWVTGDGPPFVLVHGSLCDLTRFRPLRGGASVRHDHLRDRTPGLGRERRCRRLLHRELEFEDVAAVLDAVPARTGGPVALGAPTAPIAPWAVPR
jgi:hypothetical protein